MTPTNDSSSINFSSYLDGEINDLKLLDEIDNVIKNYDIIKDNDELLTSVEKNCLSIISYLNTLLNKNVTAPKDLVNLFLNNSAFIKNINLILKTKLNNLTTKDSSYFSKDLTTILNALSVGSDAKVLTSYDDFDFEAISTLFRFYEKRLSDLNSSDRELYNLCFYSYFILLNLFDKILLMNSYMINKENKLNRLIEEITESISIIKYSINLEQKKLHLFNFIQGKLLYSYSSKHSFNFNKNDLDDSYKEYLLYIEKLEDGYNLAYESYFGDDESINKDKEFLIYQNNFAQIVLDLINNIEKNEIKSDNFLSSEYFFRIKKFYFKYFTIKTEEELKFLSLDEFKFKILDLLIYDYDINFDYTKVINHKTIIDDFIICGKNFKNSNLETIYKILYYSKEINSVKLISIAQTLSKSELIKNDYYEFFKILIFDLIIQRLSSEKIDFETEDLLSNIENYIDKNKNASHILSIYFKIYLSISLYYTKHQINMKKAKTLYSIFNKANPIKLLDKDFKDLKNKILMSFGFQHIRDLNIEFNPSSNIDLINIGDNIIKQYESYYLLERKDEINNELITIQNQIIQNKTTNIKSIYNNISVLISDDIFYGICKSHIISLDNTELRVEDVTQRETIIEIDENHAIQFVYPFAYEDNFKQILFSSEFFIKTTLANIFAIINKLNK